MCLICGFGFGKKVVLVHVKASCQAQLQAWLMEEKMYLKTPPHHVSGMHVREQIKTHLTNNALL